MQDNQPNEISKCPFQNYFRPKSSRQGVGPITYCLWTSTAKILKYFNRQTAKDPNFKQAWVNWPLPLGFLYVASTLRFLRSNSVWDPYNNRTNDTKEFGAEPEAAKHHYLADNSYTCDRENPQMGTAGTRFSLNNPQQKIRPDFEKMEPSAQDVGRICWRQPNPMVPGKDYMEPAGILNLSAMGWIQEQDHGFNGNTMTDLKCPIFQKRAPEEGWPNNRAEIARITKDYTRLSADGRPSVLNERSIAWTQTQVYGTNEEEERKVRAYAGGKLRVDERGFLLEDPEKKGIDLVAFNNNYNPWLSYWQWLFVQEHNMVADYYAYFHPDWDDETLFQMAKMVVAAEVAKEHTTRWTIDLLQHKVFQLAMMVDWYGLAGKRVKMAIMRLCDRSALVNFLTKPLRQNDFALGMAGSKWELHDAPNQLPMEFRQVYRTLHDMLPDEVKIFNPEDGTELDTIPLLDFIHHNTRSVIENFGYDALAYSFFTQSCGALTLHNFPRALTRFENQQNGLLTDLAEVDILRERES